MKLLFLKLPTASKDSAPSKAVGVEHSINVGSNVPINQPKYRVAHKDREIIKDQVQDMLKKNVIKHSMSAWASPIVLVDKKDGSIRFCVDYRKLNSITTKDSYPLPRIDDSLAALSGNQFFSGLDLNAGYWQIPMSEKDKDKTAFLTDDGLFEFNVMPFGLTNAPATFQRYMDAVLAGLKWNTLLVYIDDIIVFSKSFEEHLDALGEVFDRLIKASLQLKPSKCQFFQSELLYLGHLVTPNGIGPDPAKIKAIVSMKHPTNVSEVSSFLGMAGYYRNYIANFSRKCKILYELTKKR